MILHPYQIESEENLMQNFSDGIKHQLYVLATGGGKTVVFTDLSLKYFINDGKRVLVLTDRTELFNQAFSTFYRMGVNPSMINDKMKYLTQSLAYVAMVETLNNRLKSNNFQQAIGKIDLVIADEAHKQSHAKILEHEIFRDSLILGVTATPISTRKEKPLRGFYEKMVQSISTTELIRQGFLCPHETYSVKRKLDTKLKSKGGDYTEESQMEFFGGLYDLVVQKYQEIAPGSKALVFNVNIEHTLGQTKAFKSLGINAEYVVSDKDLTSDKQRAEILRAFKHGEITVVNNCGILCTGYDEPSIETIILNRKTKRLPLYLQMCGRGSRIFQGKDHFKIIDVGENYREHNLWDYPHDWQYIFENPQIKGSGDAPLKDCPQCYAVLPASVKICKCCGYEFIKELPIITISPDFELVKPKPKLPPKPEILKKSIQDLETFVELIQYQEAKGYKVHWIYYQAIERWGEAGALEYAKYRKWEDPKKWVSAQILESKKQLWNELKERYGLEIATEVSQEIKEILPQRHNDWFLTVKLAKERFLSNEDSFLLETPKQYGYAS